ncbi:MAG TPA: response regulator [Candidatus Saccharimonadales bacterium]|nr:response regulator [Candidatus Saccharimonadales bacterium]
MDLSSQPNEPIAPSGNAAGRAILCIEDEHFISELYARALSKSGYRVTSMSDGQKGLAEAETNKYDIILLDLMVPNLTGIEILRKLRDPARVPPLKSKIIITTNLEQREDVRAEIEKQADGYLIKAEITPHELVDFVNRVK